MSIDNKVAQVFNGFINLTSSQKKEFIELVNSYQRGDTVSNEQLRESVTGSVTKMQTGPYRDTCTCCGK